MIGHKLCVYVCFCRGEVSLSSVDQLCVCLQHDGVQVLPRRFQMSQKILRVFSLPWRIEGKFKELFAECLLTFVVLFTLSLKITE